MLLYSVRFSRRAVTRPASGGAASSARASSSSIQRTTAACSASLGRGSSFGGISPVRTLRATFSQVRGSRAMAAGVALPSRSRPPFLSFALWQR